MVVEEVEEEEVEVWKLVFGTEKKAIINSKFPTNKSKFQVNNLTL